MKKWTEAGEYLGRKYWQRVDADDPGNADRQVTEESPGKFQVVKADGDHWWYGEPKWVFDTLGHAKAFAESL